MSRRDEHKKEMEEFRRRQREEEKRKQKENEAAVAGSALKNAPETTTYYLPSGTNPGITNMGLNPGLQVQNSLLELQEKEREYAGFSDSFSKMAHNEELMGNYPDSRYLWQQATEMSRKAKNAADEAAYLKMVADAGAMAGMKTVSSTAPGSAPKPEKGGGTGKSKVSGTYADRETLQLQIDQITKERQSYVAMSRGKADKTVLDWYDRQLRNLYSAQSGLPTAPVREDILLRLWAETITRADQRWAERRDRLASAFWVPISRQMSGILPMTSGTGMLSPKDRLPWMRWPCCRSWVD